MAPRNSDQTILDNINALEETLRQDNGRVRFCDAAERRSYASNDAAYALNRLKAFGGLTDKTIVIDAGSGTNLLLNKHFQDALNTGAYRTELKFFAINLAENTKKYMEAFKANQYAPLSSWDKLLHKARRPQLVQATQALRLDLSNDEKVKKLGYKNAEQSNPEVLREVDIIFLYRAYADFYMKAENTARFKKARSRADVVGHILTNLLGLLKTGGILIVDDLRPPLSMPSEPNAGQLLFQLEAGLERETGRRLFARVWYLGEGDYPVLIVQKA